MRPPSPEAREQRDHEGQLEAETAADLLLVPPGARALGVAFGDARVPFAKDGSATVEVDESVDVVAHPVLALGISPSQRSGEPQPTSPKPAEVGRVVAGGDRVVVRPSVSVVVHAVVAGERRRPAPTGPCRRRAARVARRCPARSPMSPSPSLSMPSPHSPRVSLRSAGLAALGVVGEVRVAIGIVVGAVVAGGRAELVRIRRHRCSPGPPGSRRRCRRPRPRRCRRRPGPALGDDRWRRCSPGSAGKSVRPSPSLSSPSTQSGSSVRSEGVQAVGIGRVVHVRITVVVHARHCSPAARSGSVRANCTPGSAGQSARVSESSSRPLSQGRARGVLVRHPRGRRSPGRAG